jgi:YggT family protein
MITAVLLVFFDLFASIFKVLLLARVISSYFANPSSGWYQGLVNITEPVLAPVRRMLPAMGGFDLAPLVTFFLLQGLQALLYGMFPG